jgi:hypothetical protein
MRIWNDDGRELDATFSVASHDGIEAILFYESRGGTRGTTKARNVEYNEGLDLLLLRLGTLGATLTDALIESRGRHLPEAQRRLDIRGLPFIQIPSNLDDARRLRLRIGRGQDHAGGALGGRNRTRRLRLVASLPTVAFTREGLERHLAAGAAGPTADSSMHIAEGASEADQRRDFEPADETDARSRTMRAIAARQGQPRFRAELLHAYGHRCAITRCDAEAVLEAAHILPYRGAHTNHVQNGLLLRADVHTLMDRCLLGVRASDYTVVIHSALASTQYRKLAGTKIHTPEQARLKPSKDALNAHLRMARLA